MPFDSLTMTAVTAELTKKIIGTKVVKIHQPDRFTMMLRLRGPSCHFKLLLSAHPVFGRLHLADTAEENPATPPMFCMVMRKHLENAKISNIQQLDNDRIVVFDFDATDEIGTPVKRQLILEIMGKHSNLILINPENNLILDGIRRYSHVISRHREVLPGKEYIAPPQTNKINPDELNYETFLQVILEHQQSSQDEQTLKNLLYQNFAGISPFLAGEILVGSGFSQTATTEFFGEYEYTKLWQNFSRIIQLKKTADFSPVLLKNGMEYYDYYPIKLASVDETNQEAITSISEALATFYQKVRDQGSFKNQHTELLKTIGKEEQRLNKKIALEQADLDSTINAERYKDAGDLLTTYMYLLEKGMTEISLDSFYEADKKIKISLLAELTPIENIKRYYHKFNKAKSSQRLITEQLATNLAELEYVETIMLALENAQTLEELTLVKEELQESGYLKQKVLKKSQKDFRKNTKVKAESQPPLEFTSSDGYKILVGRNNKQNDKLTLKTAAKNDIWLHTQKIPGSHVIIKKQGENPISDVALLEAAALAAYHSKARLSSQVPVDYTTVDQVKKPSGAKPGMVIYFQQKTLYVTPALPKIHENQNQNLPTDAYEDE